MDKPCNCHAFGIYRGSVSDNNDPEGLMRLRLVVPQVFGTETVTGWAWPCIGVGDTDVPDNGAPVWVMFIGGDVEHPVWVGTWRMV